MDKQSRHLIQPHPTSSQITQPHSISQNNYKLLSNFFANFFFYSFQNILHFVEVITLCKIFVSRGENKFFTNFLNFWVIGIRLYILHNLYNQGWVDSVRVGRHSTLEHRRNTCYSYNTSIHRQ